MKRIVPKVFVDTMEQRLDLFVGGLGFTVLHQDHTLAVVGRDEIAARRPELLHPNLPTVRQQPWGSTEFALRDVTNVCIVFRQWPWQPEDDHA